MRNIPFTKVEADGNNFVLIDALRMPELDWSAQAVRMCAHHFGVGADGLLVLLPSHEADFRLRMFNPDGTEDACGNGLRCAAVYIRSVGLSTKPELVFEAKDGLRHVETVQGAGRSPIVKANMGRPSLRSADIPANLDADEALDYPLDVGGQVYRMAAVLVGTPHAVICAPLESFWTTIPAASRAIEVHRAFPERINVTWCSVESPESLQIRTWERGVGPTLGCGSGACAALVAAHLRGLTGTHARVTSPGGAIEVNWPGRGEIFMSGPANVVFHGKWSNGVSGHRGRSLPEP
ncbi:MAG TPA: diaminopimelate epimerase [Armatimonadota bacterium]|nr:diaminopimelate epimerase [Armatimonadota bacterium]